MKKTLNKYLGEITLGGIDGLVTTFAVIAGSEGAGFSHKVIIILSMANVIADGFSMATSTYFSMKCDKWNNNKTCFEVAFVVFLSFIFCGILPVYVYIFNIQPDLLIASIITGLSFLAIGALKGLINKTNFIRQSLQTFIFGTIAAVLAFVLGDLLGPIIT